MLSEDDFEGSSVNWRDLGTPPGLIKSDTCRADRRRAPAPKHTHIAGWAWPGIFSAWGVTGIIFGILLAYRWSRWYALVFVGLVGIR